MAQRADVALVTRGFFESRAKAQAAIAAGLVSASGVVVQKPSQSIAEDVVIEASAPHPWVGRGGVKLAFALAHFGIDVAGKRCLDVGSSTGGFSHVLLEKDAAHIDAVDTGHGQFHDSLRKDARINLFEGCDIRAFQPQAPVDFAAIDVSFIPLGMVLPKVAAMLAAGSMLVALIKPQFEAGKKDIGKGGVVKDDAVHKRVCQNVQVMLEQLGFMIMGLTESPITGGDGNREFLIAARKGAA